MKIVLLTVKSGDPLDLHLNDKSFAVELHKQIDTNGGKCITSWENKFLRFIIQGVDKPAIDQLVGPFIDAAQRNQRRLEFIIEEWEKPYGYDLDHEKSSRRLRLTLRREILTKKLIVGLPSGVFVAGNYCSKDRNAFAEEIGAPDTRLASWNRAVAAGANGCVCAIVGTKQELSRIVFSRPVLGL